MIRAMYFEWDENKNRTNIEKHKVSFETAKLAFMDENRVISKDIKHSIPEEERYFCFGLVQNKILTVRFIFRDEKIRIIGAGYWREGVLKYEKQIQ